MHAQKAFTILGFAVILAFTGSLVGAVTHENDTFWTAACSGAAIGAVVGAGLGYWLGSPPKG